MNQKKNRGLQLSQQGASIFIPDGVEQSAALGRVTHLGVGAHPDDLEIMAYHGIAECMHPEDAWFAGVTCTDGGGTPRSGPYAHYTNREMAAVRHREQETAARIGRYGAMIQLNLSSGQAKQDGGAFRDDLRRIFESTGPRIVYTHNLADKHSTHIAVALAVIDVVRALPPGRRPEAVYGCEVWRGLDWMLDEDKIAMNVTAYPSLSSALVSAFDSQITGGKRYDLATPGRRYANATYHQSHHSDQSELIALAMDLTPLVQSDQDPVDYVTGFLKRFEEDVVGRIQSLRSDS